MSVPRRLKAAIVVVLLAMTFDTGGCLPENYYADLAANSISEIVDASLAAALDCLLAGDSTAQ